jgi:hypothetical protein
MLGVRPNGDAAGAQRLHDGGVRSAVRGITVESLEIETDGELDLRGFLEGAFFPPPGLVIDPDTQTRDRCFGDWPLGNWTPSYTGHISKIGSCGGVSAVADGRVRPVLERRRRVLLHGSVPDVTPMGLWADYR